MALESTFEEETVVDLVGEQSAGAKLYASRMLCEVMIEAGCSPEAALLEVYASGEGAVCAQATAELGLWKQLRLHSHTSQYGHQARGKMFVTEKTRELYRKLVADVKSGAFQKEWAKVQADGMKELDKLYEENLSNPLMALEDELYRELGRRK